MFPYLKKLVFMFDWFFKVWSEPWESVSISFLDSDDWKYMVIYIFKFINKVFIVSSTVFIHIQSSPVSILYTVFIFLNPKFIDDS